MRESKPSPDFIARIKNKKFAAIVMFIASVVIGVSTFTNAARNLSGLVSVEEARAAINGDWVADVIYDWPNAKHMETFSLSGTGGELRGIASFLGVKRGIVEGKTQGGRVEFLIKSREGVGDAGKDVEHRYTGTLVGDEIRFVMQTDGSVSPHVPVEFVAHRLVGAAHEDSK